MQWLQGGIKHAIAGRIKYTTIACQYEVVRKLHSKSSGPLQVYRDLHQLAKAASIWEMRVKPGRVKPAPLSPVPDCQPSPRQTNSYLFKADPEKAVQDLVERRVRSSLKLVQRGELTPAQALRAVVNTLADELTDSQYQHLVTYFRSKEIKGQLAPAKQLLLRHLTSAKSCLPATGTRDQQQQTSYSSKANSAAVAVGGLADKTNKRRYADQGFCSSSSNQAENWDVAKQSQFVPVQQQVCGIKAAGPWPSTGVGILRLDL